MKKSWVLLFLVVLFVGRCWGQAHPDPFTQSSRLPDISVGVGIMQNLENTFEVQGYSLSLHGDYYDFVSNFSLGVEMARNLDRLGQFESSVTNPTDLEKAREFEGLTYDHTVVALRAGKLMKNNLIIIGSLGFEFLRQYRFYQRTISNQAVERYYISTGKKDILNYYKLALMYKIRRVGLEGYISRRGVGVSLHYFVNQ